MLSVWRPSPPFRQCLVLSLPVLHSLSFTHSWHSVLSVSLFFLFIGIYFLLHLAVFVLISLHIYHSYSGSAESSVRHRRCPGHKEALRKNQLLLTCVPGSPCLTLDLALLAHLIFQFFHPLICFLFYPILFLFIHHFCDPWMPLLYRFCHSLHFLHF